MSTPPPHIQQSGTFRFAAHPSLVSLPRSVTPSSDEMSLIMSENDSIAAHSLSGFTSPTILPNSPPLPQAHGKSSVIWRYFKKVDDKGECAVCLVQKATPSGVCGQRKSM